MKLKPIVFIKSAIAYIRTLGWGKEDIKKILMFIIMLLIACFILNNFLLIKITQGRRDRLTIDGSIYTDTSISGKIDADVSGDITANDPMGGFDVRIRQ